MNLNLKHRSFFFASMAVAVTSLCKDGEVAMNSEPSSIWKMRTSHPSCVGEYKSEGFSQCKDDPTSIVLDMSKVRNKAGCHLYTTSEALTWKFKVGTEITFDAEWDGCEQVWMAPLWLLPSRWQAPQGRSGEIDLIETCRTHAKETTGTSIICGDHWSPECYEPQWGSANNDGGHFKGKIDADGTWTMEKCDLHDNSRCELVSRYPKYLTTNTGSKEGMKFHFASDLYNGGAGQIGDGGWNSCGTLNLNTNCKYTVANVKVADRSLGTQCKDWCEADRDTHPDSRLCGSGNMASLCGGCYFCKPAGVCKDWCKADRGTHPDSLLCGSGDMAIFCGGCDFCQSARTEL